MQAMLISVLQDKVNEFIDIENSSVDKLQRLEVKNVGYQKNNSIAVIPINGYAYDVDNIRTEYGLGFSYEGVEQQIDEAIANGANTIVFDMNTPGGYGIGAESLIDKIYSLREQGVKTIAQIHNLCCSAGYRIASQCENIYAPADGIVGCLGTYTVVYDESEAFKKDGIKTLLISSGGIKGVGAPGTEITDEYKQVLQKQVDTLNNKFKEEVARGRSGLNMEQIDKLFTGETWLGKQAVENGLVDKRQTLSQTLKSLNKKDKEMEEKKEIQQAVVTLAELDSFKMASSDFKLDCLRNGFTVEQARDKYIAFLESENERLENESTEKHVVEQEAQKPEQPKHEAPVQQPSQSEEKLNLPGNSKAVNTSSLEMKKTASELINEHAKEYAKCNNVSMEDAVYAVMSSNPELAAKLYEEGGNANG